MYKITLAKSAVKELRNLPLGVQERLKKSLEKLESFPSVSVKKLQGLRSHFRFRVGDYRVIFITEEKEKVITITRIRHRNEKTYRGIF
ncbi:type II toxin-antitoxin system RelE/ParE family toxin [Candidatus Gracilibacteria bacterium]|nr:type II toxin-antitoxin system RelE/ParE family toxin [Candidatus Gracilibacteria bacterium]